MKVALLKKNKPLNNFDLKITKTAKQFSMKGKIEVVFQKKNVFSFRGRGIADF